MFILTYDIMHKIFNKLTYIKIVFMYDEFNRFRASYTQNP